jgi:hypothetical protein
MKMLKCSGVGSFLQPLYYIFLSYQYNDSHVTEVEVIFWIYLIIPPTYHTKIYKTQNEHKIYKKNIKINKIRSIFFCFQKKK